MKIISLFLWVFILGSFGAIGQDTIERKTATKESRDYDAYRQQISYPVYSLKKVEEMTDNIKLRDDTAGYSAKRSLNQKAYLSLSLREKFTYHMIFPESYSQNCDVMPPIQDEQKKIFGELPDAFGEYNWSERQSKFFLANRDSVIQMMRNCIAKDNQIGLNFKHAIVDISAREMIPMLISFYNGHKRDHDILTVLMLLMKDSEYDQFLLSVSYKKLYADPDASYKSFLTFNTANEALILKRATDFYNGQHQ